LIKVIVMSTVTKDWFTLTLADGQREKIARAAELKRTSMGAIVRQCIDVGISRMEKADAIL